ncbi:YncE family protein [Zavarzinella formosa]|uniref:hypothetical protein n=1 Tax=Zavarzinella formosa TaxID=360055 RepID=UPI000304A5AD|nr:hypothetical protein [Zavarzinella formosa]
MAVRYQCDVCGVISPLPDSRLGKANKCPNCTAPLPRWPLPAHSGKGLIYALVFGGLLLVFGGLGAVGTVAWFTLKDDVGPQVAVNNPAPDQNKEFPRIDPRKIEHKDGPPWRAPDPKMAIKKEWPERKPEERKPEEPKFEPPKIEMPAFGPNVPKIEINIPPRVVPPAPPLKLPPAPARLPIKPWAGTERKEYSLPEVADRAIPAGDGRFIVFHFSKIRKLGLFDVNEGKITKYVDLAEDKPLITAGMNKIVTYLPEAGMIQRHNLLTGERELMKPLKLAGNIKQLAMGSASAGPVAVATEQGGILLDLETLTRMQLPDVPAPANPPFGNPDPQPVHLPFTTDKLWAGANGRAFASVNRVRDHCTVVLDSGGADVKSRFGEIFFFGKPSPDGRRFFFGGVGAITSDGRFDAAVVLPKEPLDARKGLMLLPAEHGPYYFRLNYLSESGGPALVPKDSAAAVSVHAYGVDKPLIRLASMPVAGWKNDVSLTESVLFIPRAGLLTVLSPSRDKLNLIPVDLDQAMDDSGMDYLLVTSQPPRTYSSGREFRYPVRVRSRAGKLMFNLESGPAGMKVAPDGTISWKPDITLNDREISVVLNVKDGTAKETLHVFTLRKSDEPEEYVPDPEPRKPVPVVIEEPKGIPDRIAYKLPAIPGEATINPHQPADKDNPTDIPVPGKFDSMIPAGGGRYVILHAKAAMKAHVFDVNTMAIERTIDVGDANATVTAGMTRLFVYQPGTQTVERFALADGKSHGRESRLFGKTAELVIGSASEGPLFVRAGKWAALFDAESLAPMTLPMTDKDKSLFPFSTGGVWASANGRTFANVSSRNGAGEIRAATLTPDAVTVRSAEGTARYVQPGPDGKLLFFGGHPTRRASLDSLRDAQPDLASAPDPEMNVLPVPPEDAEALVMFEKRLEFGVRKSQLRIRRSSSQMIAAHVDLPGMDEQYRNTMDLPACIQVNLMAGACLMAPLEKDRLRVVPLRVSSWTMPPKADIAWRLPPVPAAPPEPLKPTTLKAPSVQDANITNHRLTFGGGGRFLIDLPKPCEIRVYDLIANRVHLTIRTTAPNPPFAAGQSKLVISDGEQSRLGWLRRYDLETGKLEQSEANRHEVVHLSMGAASEGPLILVCVRQLEFMDLSTLSKMKTGEGKKKELPMARLAPVVSADGRTMFSRGLLRDDKSFMVMMEPDGTRMVPYSPASEKAYAALSGDGKAFFLGNSVTDQTGYFSKLNRPMPAAGSQLPPLIPSLTGDYCLEVHSSRYRQGNDPDYTGLVVYKSGRREPVGRIIKAFEGIPSPDNITERSHGSYLITAIPDANLVVWHDRTALKTVLLPVNFNNLPMDPVPENVKPMPPATKIDPPKVNPPMTKIDPPMPMIPKVDPPRIGPPVAATKHLVFPPWPAPLPIKSHDLKEPVTYTFEQPAKLIVQRGTVALAGGGRFILRQRDPKTIDVFDLDELKVTRTIELFDGAGAWLAGMTKLFVQDVRSQSVRRFDLLTGKEEKQGPMLQISAQLMSIGHRTDGPLIARDGQSGIVLIDGDSLEPFRTTETALSGPDIAGKFLWSSPDGRTIGVSMAPPGASLLSGLQPRISTNLLTFTPVGLTKEVAPFPTAFAIPANDAGSVYTGGYGPLSPKLTKFNNTDISLQPAQGVPPVSVMLPSADGHFVMRYHWTKSIPAPLGTPKALATPDTSPGFDLYAGGNIAKPIMTVKTIDPLEKEFNPFMSMHRMPELVHFIPKAKVLVVVSGTLDKIHVYPADLEAEMAKSGVEAPWVTSTPPAVFVPGELWKYPLKVTSRLGGLKFTVSGPAAMKVDENGELTWPVPPDARLDTKVIVYVKDAKGNLAIHVFWMTKK